MRFKNLTFTGAAPGNLEELVHEFKRFRNDRKRSHMNIARSIQAIAARPPDEA